MKDNRTLYERSVQGRSTLRYYLGLIIRWKQNWNLTSNFGVLTNIAFSHTFVPNLKFNDYV